MPEPNSVCRVCGQAFYVKPALIRLRNGGQHCSRACRSITQSRERLGNAPNWLGDAATQAAGRCRARKRFALGPCERCDEPGADRHHKDGNTLNNEPDNIAILCRRCHMEADGRSAALAEGGRRRARLSDEQVREIWQRVQGPRYRGMYPQLAKEYGVAEVTIRGIASRRLHARITGKLPDTAVS